MPTIQQSLADLLIPLSQRQSVLTGRPDVPIPTLQVSFDFPVKASGALEYVNPVRLELRGVLP